MRFGKHALYSVYGTNANGTMSVLGFALLFGNEDKQSWMQFQNFIKKTHPIVYQSNYTIITGQDKGSLSAMKNTDSLAGRFLCSFHRQQNIIKKCGGGTGQRPLSAMCMYNLLMGCKSVASLSATRKKYEEKMHPTDRHYLFNIAKEMQFPAARCAQGNSVCMYGKTASSGVEAMNRANEDIHHRTAVDILNATLILLKKESTRYDKQHNLAWKHTQKLNPKGMELMEEAFQNVNIQDFKVYLTENDNQYTSIVSKKSTSERKYSKIIPKSDTLGSRFGKCTCGFPKKEGIPCQYMMAIQKLGRVDGLTRAAVMLHWYTKAQWYNQFPENTYIGSHPTLQSIKANSTPHDELRYCPNWLGPQKKGCLKKDKCKKSIADYIKQSATKKHRTTKATKTPEEEIVDLEGKDVEDGQEGKA
jgi:hypothetical protein